MSKFEKKEANEIICTQLKQKEFKKDKHGSLNLVSETESDNNSKAQNSQRIKIVKPKVVLTKKKPKKEKPCEERLLLKSFDIIK